MNVRRLSGAVVCAVAVWSLWTCTASAAARTRPVVSAAYGVLGARALNVGVRVVGAGSRARGARVTHAVAGGARAARQAAAWRTGSAALARAVAPEDRDGACARH
jgi:hypothetical protein